jgi:hypothetical protein
MPKSIILVHGYSVRTLDTYGMLPQLLANDGYKPEHLFLSAFDSLNDDITCDDLANALEFRIAQLESAGLDTSDTGVIGHSTGAMIVRRWMLNRHKNKAKLPSHFISLAGANHGSTLAQLGRTQIAYLFRELGGTSVGAEVLQDLDYGSDFLLLLNEEWMDAHLSENPPDTYSFSLIGDDHSAFELQLFWQTHEDGSDGTVRVSGGNLNYRIISIDQNAARPVLSVKQLPNKMPHLVLSGVSHTGENGILGGNAATMQKVYPQVKEALSIANKPSYGALASAWQSKTDTWRNENAANCCSTIVFSLQHPGGRKVEDSLILIKDQNSPDDHQSLSSVKSSLEPHQPIQNDAAPSSVSFYVNFPRFQQTYPHTVEIRVNSGSDEITYPLAVYNVLAGTSAAIDPNEFSYVRVTLKRQPQETYEVIPFSQNVDIHKRWPPLPKPTGP